MHVPLRRAEVAMAGEFLHRSRRRAAHREVRAERVSQDVRSRVPRLATGCEPCLARRAADRSSDTARVRPSGADAAAAHSRVGSSSGRTARDCDDFKAGVVRLVLDEGKTVGAVTRDMDLTRRSIQDRDPG